jgi:maltose alpha-D-glucosyltransferase/alpha-amylase
VPEWLNDVVLYQIYPQSFADSNGDGIGDLNGIVERLDYLEWLGVNTLWLNPVFASPMRDAGYDVSDHRRVDPRYGTNDDLARLVDNARRRGIRILLDLVAGHTSDQHRWFAESAQDAADHRYIWTEREPLPARFVASPGPRPGGYLPNFFDFQPALNFGYGRPDPDEPWRQPPDAAGPGLNRAALREIMAHWLDVGVSGFRVDMAASLVKDDPGRAETAKLWGDVRTWLDTAYPQAALLAEWGDPAASARAGLHADFFLQFGGPANGEPLRSLWHTGTATTRDEWGSDPCYFDAQARGTFTTFLGAYEKAVAAVGEPGRIALPTGNHDYARLHTDPRAAAQLPVAFAFQLTFPTVPAIYYGDEVGMRYLPELSDKEGSELAPRYNRAGSRTPMQWSDGRNAGFSAAAPDRLYLPVDPDPERPVVAAQREDPHSLLRLVKDLIAMRANHPALRPDSPVDVVSAGYPLVYLRGEDFLVVLNPSVRAEAVVHDRPELGDANPIRHSGVRVDRVAVTAAPYSFGIFSLDSRPDR